MDINKKTQIEIGERLLQLQKSLNKKQFQFAEELGFSSGNGLSMIQKGNNPLQPTHYKLLELTYNVNVNWLKTGEGEMFVKKTSGSINSESYNNLNINNQITDPMTIETINKMLDIISRQQDDIHLAQLNQANLIDKIPGGIQERKKASGGN